MDHVALTLDGSVDHHSGPSGAMRWTPPEQAATARPPSAPQPAEPTPPAPTGTPGAAEPITAAHNGPELTDSELADLRTRWLAAALDRPHQFIAPPAPQPRRWWQRITNARRKAAR